MNNQFVKDSLLPDEKILATARFHPIKNWIAPVLFLVISAGIYIALANSHSMIVHNSFWLYSYRDSNAWYKLITGIDYTSDDRGEKCMFGTGEKYVYPHMTVSEFEAMIGVSNLKVDVQQRYTLSTAKSLYWWIITALIVSLVYLLTKWINSKDEFVITNKRVVAKVGLIRRVAFELHNEQMESIEISQGIVGRILNFGTLMPCGIGASKVRILFVVSPFEFRQHFYELKKPKNVD